MGWGNYTLMGWGNHTLMCVCGGGWKPDLAAFFSSKE